MSEELVKSVQDMLNEEKWTRAAISNYTKNQFIELAITVEKAREANCLDEIKEICDEHLSHTKNSIIALYLSGMIGLKKQALDNSSLITLVNIFIEQQNKMDIVTYLCESILGEDEEAYKTALMSLGTTTGHSPNITSEEGVGIYAQAGGKGTSPVKAPPPDEED